MLGSWRKLRDHCILIYLNGKALAQVTTIHYLGVIIDQNLTWKTHVNYVLRKVRCKLYALQHLRPLPGRLLPQLYQALILPVFNYCIVVWMPYDCSAFKASGVYSFSYFTRTIWMFFFCQISINGKTSFVQELKSFATVLPTIFALLVCVCWNNYRTSGWGLAFTYMYHKFSHQLEKNLLSINLEVYPQICVTLNVFQILRFHFKNWFVSIVFFSFACYC